MKDGKKGMFVERIGRIIKSTVMTAGTLCLIAANHSATAMPLTVPQIQTATTNTLRYQCRGGSTLT